MILIVAGLSLVTAWWYGKDLLARYQRERSLPAPEKTEKGKDHRLRDRLKEGDEGRLSREESAGKEGEDAEAGELMSALLEDRLADVAEAASPAVVNVFTEKKIRRGPMPRLFEDPMFRRFFGPEFGPPEEGPGPQGDGPKENALGSGVIVSPDGYILTNHHVIEGADSIKVALSDKREFDASLVGSDPETDLAVLKIEAQDLPILSFGDSDKVRVGQVVLAIGNPFGLSHTVTMGIVSARGRSGMGVTDYEDFIQTDAAINPGNSGGALINLSGRLIGINTAIFSRTGGYEGVGFAIPSNQARDIMEDLIAHGSVTRGWLGVSMRPFEPDLAEELGFSSELVGQIATDSNVLRDFFWFPIGRPSARPFDPDTDASAIRDNRHFAAGANAGGTSLVGTVES
jgi:S1-C subfamily serine protease